MSNVRPESLLKEVYLKKKKTGRHVAIGRHVELFPNRDIFADFDEDIYSCHGWEKFSCTLNIVYKAHAVDLNVVPQRMKMHQNAAFPWKDSKFSGEEYPTFTPSTTFDSPSPEMIWYGYTFENRLQRQRQCDVFARVCR